MLLLFSTYVTIPSSLWIYFFLHIFSRILHERTKKKAMKYKFIPVFLILKIIHEAGSGTASHSRHLSFAQLTPSSANLCRFLWHGDSIRIIFSHRWIVLKQFLQYVRHCGCSLASGMHILLASFFLLNKIILPTTREISLPWNSALYPFPPFPFPHSY